MDKLIIKKKSATPKSEGIVIKINDKSNQMLEDIIKRTGKSKTFVANRLIEFAYKYVEVVDDDEEDDSE